MVWFLAGKTDKQSFLATLARCASRAVQHHVGYRGGFFQYLQRIQTDAERDTGYAAVEPHDLELRATQFRQDIALGAQDRVSLHRLEVLAQLFFDTRGRSSLAATVDYLFGYNRDQHIVEDWMYERVTNA